ncbi:MAG: DUF6444 domain-containing protein [Pseudonocardiaceae bacterium]
MSVPEPSYGELAALVAGLVARVAGLETENAELRRRLGMNSTNSSAPPSEDSIAAKAKRRADRSSRERSKDREPGGQPGPKGSGLSPAVTPDRTQTLPPPGECRGCGGDLGDAATSSPAKLPGFGVDRPPFTAAKTASNASVNRESRSRCRNLIVVAWSPMSIMRLRAA